ETLYNFQKAIKGQSVKFESVFHSAKGTELNLEISLVPIKQDNTIIGVYGIAKDFTGIRRSEKIIVEKKNFLHANATMLGALLENQLDKTALLEAFAVIGNAVAADRMFYYSTAADQEENHFVIE